MQFVDAVGEHLPGNAREILAQRHRFERNSECIGQFASLTEQFEADFGYTGAVKFAIY
jgi:hypothetical protein